MPKISKKQYQLYKKILDNLPKEELDMSVDTSSLERDIIDFLKSFIEENYFGYVPSEKVQKINNEYKRYAEFLRKSAKIDVLDMERKLLPSIIVKDLKDSFGSYNRADNVIAIGKNSISQVAHGKESLYELLNTLGHEFEHFLQHNVDFEELTNEQVKEYLDNVVNDLVGDVKVEVKLVKEVLNLTDREKRIIKNVCEDKKDKSKFLEFLCEVLSSDSEEDIKDLLDYVKLSEYLAMNHEKDARYKGIIFVSQFINDAVAMAEENDEIEYVNKFANDRKAIENMINEEEEFSKHEIKGYNKYQQIVSNADLPSLNYLATSLLANDVDIYSVKNLIYAVQEDKYASLLKLDPNKAKETVLQEMDAVAKKSNQVVEDYTKMEDRIEQIEKDKWMLEKEKRAKSKEYLTKRDINGYIANEDKYKNEINKLKEEEKEIKEYINSDTANLIAVQSLYMLYDGLFSKVPEINSAQAKQKLKELVDIGLRQQEQKYENYSRKQ